MNMNLGSWARKNKQEILIVVMLLIVAGIPRLLDLGLFLTADEKNWIGRSYEFIRAFKDFRFNDMLQTTHPGVTTTWLVGASITAKMLLSHIPFSFNNMVHFVKAAQLPIALVTTLTIPIIYFLTKRLLSHPIAVAASLLIALDPFLIGHSRVAHVDGLLAHLLFIAALGLLVYRQTKYDRRWLLFSAVVASLAILTKIPAIFLLPFFWLVVITDRSQRNHLLLLARLKDFVMWTLIIGLLFVTLWPAILWVPNPQGNVLVLKRDFVQASITPHNAVEDYTLNSAHYPLALLVRSTPILLVGNLLAFILVTWQSIAIARKSSPSHYRLPITDYWLLLSYSFFFIVMMTIGAKKGDRYILPVWPALALMATIGYWRTAELLARYRNISPGKVFTAIATLLVLSTGYTVWHYHPYTLAYASPLFKDNLSQELGWGEGLEQVAAWLNTNAPTSVVASWYPEELGAYTTAQIAHINAHQQGKVQYVVLYRNMFGRSPEHYANDFIDEYYKKREPIFIAHVAGKEFAWVYDKWVFENIVGELLPGTVVTQQIPVATHLLYGIDILPATYSSTVNRGELLVRLKDSQGTLIQEWRTLVTKLNDNEWLTLALSTPKQITDRAVTVEISAEGTIPDNAPTIRITRKYSYRPGDVGGSIKHQGDVAVRLRYVISGQQVTEEEGKLLRQLESK